MPINKETMPSISEKPSYFHLVNDGEPFRLLFPVGFLLGLIGVLLWPVWVWKWMDVYPSLMHSRIMVQGFLSAFVMGFLGTAFPRMIEARKLGTLFSIPWALALVAACGIHLLQLHLVGDILYFLTLLSFVLTLANRLRERKDLPPPVFVLVFAGLACALLGTLLQIAQQLVPEVLPLQAFPLSRLLLNQGFLLLPVMGVGAHFLPRFFGQTSLQKYADSIHPPLWWIRDAFISGTFGLAIIVSFFFESYGWFRTAYTVRAATILIYFIKEFPAFKSKGSTGSLATAARVALLSLPLAYLAMIFQPLYSTSLAHIVFITGFSLLALSVATWVLLGHSGCSHLCKASLWQIRLLWIFVFLAMLTRVSADWMPDLRFTHYAYAAIVWSIGTIVWAVRFLPRVRIPDE